MIRIGIMGYGNLGRGVECAVQQNPDMELTAVFTRRDPSSVHILTPTAQVCAVQDVAHWQDKIDVMILCGGSATDLPEQTPRYAALFHVVDSFDTHARIPDHFTRVDAAAAQAGKVAVISTGWDPGLFSLARVYAHATLPKGNEYTFWGRGVSQGHSDAIRHIPGVKYAKQYTVPVEAALSAVRAGENPPLSTRQKHIRQCFVVPEEGADTAAIHQAICNMPYYFADYDTQVYFINEETFLCEHSGMPHGGSVLRSGQTGWENEHNALFEFNLKLESNPEFTASVLCACARAVFRLAREGQSGCKTLLDIAPRYLSPLPNEQLRAAML